MDERKERLKESILHSVIIVAAALVILSVFILEIKNDVILLIASVVGIAFIFIFVRRPLDKKYLALNSNICMLAVLASGVIIGKYISPTSALTVGLCMGFVDVLSFTRIGKNTMNAKVMSNKALMSKLIVYGASFKNGAPVPTKGLGDFAYYAILLSSLFKLSQNATILLWGCIAVFLGCAVNWTIVCIIYRKPWYKGFPATIIPFAFLLPLLVMYMK